MKHIKRIIYCCSGASNVGQLANQACSSLQDNGFGEFKGIVKLAAGNSETQINENTAVLAVDGCDKHCAKKLLTQHNISLKHHLTITDLGIDKSEVLSIKKEDLQLVIDGVHACCSDVGEDNMSFAMSKSKCPCFS